jgi:hypothetical protein
LILQREDSFPSVPNDVFNEWTQGEEGEDDSQVDTFIKLSVQRIQIKELLLLLPKIFQMSPDITTGKTKVENMTNLVMDPPKRVTVNNIKIMNPIISPII